MTTDENGRQRGAGGRSEELGRLTPTVQRATDDRVRPLLPPAAASVYSPVGERRGACRHRYRLRPRRVYSPRRAS